MHTPLSVTQAGQLFAAGRRHLESGELAAARLAFEQVLQADPRHADAINMLGVVARKDGQLELALEYACKAVELRPQDAGLHASHGLACRSLGRLDEAIECYQRVLALRPNFAPAHNNFGVMLSEVGRVEEAANAFRTALELSPGFEEARRNLANASEQVVLRAKYRDNLRLFHDVLEKTPFARKYFVFAGLLLGWAREGRILPHDYFDADFGYRIEDRQLLIDTFERLQQAGFVSGVRWPEQNMFIFFKDGARFEFYEMTKVADGLRYSVVGQDKQGDFWDVTYLIPVDELDSMYFLERSWLKPKNHEELLSTCYGNWRVPDRSHNCVSDDKSIVERHRVPSDQLKWLPYLNN